MLRSVIAVAIGLSSAACVGAGNQEFRRAQASRLAAELRTLGPQVSKNEAERLAVTAVEKSAELGASYRPVTFGWLNNNLVNSGIRNRGLCWHWRDDLFPHLHALRLRTLDLHLATSRRGHPLEHNAIVVTARAQSFENGILLDPWRRGGELVWKDVANECHPWLKLPPELTPDSLRPILFSR